jgi:hypothetical protein
MVTSWNPEMQPGSVVVELSMREGFFRTVFAGFVATTLYSIHESKAHADDWGCQVILCLSNPGGPTEVAECRPPITRLWKHLAKGGSFPTCSGVGFSAARPGYEPYFCDVGFRLLARAGDRRQEVACVSSQPVAVSNEHCAAWRDNAKQTGHWSWEDGRRVCKAILTVKPHLREQPHFVDVTIDGVGRQRVWF